MSRPVFLLVVAVVCGALASIAGLIWLAPEVDTGHGMAATTFLGLVVLSRVFGYRLQHRSLGSIAFFPALALACVSPHWSAVVAIAVAEMIVGAIRRPPLQKIVFNAAQHAVAVAVGIFLYRLAGGESLMQSEGHFVAPFLLMSIGYFAANSVLVSSVIAASEKMHVWTVWKKNNTGSLIYDTFAIPFIYLFAFSYVWLGPLGPILLTVPLLGVRELYQKNEKLIELNRELLELMVAAIEARDPYTSGHSRRVAQNAQVIGKALGLGPRAMERLQIAALLHDVGKIFEMYAAILQKPGRLTEEERLTMETHPLKSAELVARVSQLSDVVIPIRHHHENWDGSGYPSQLEGNNIPLASRIIMIADTIDAMMTDRPYRKALSGEQVIEELLRLSGRQFDPAICERVLTNAVARRQLFDRRSNSLAKAPLLETPVSKAVSGRHLRIEAS